MMIYKMIIYNILRFFLYVIILMVSLFKRSTREFFRKRLFQEIGTGRLGEGRAILIHMSSVGEFNLSKELIERLLAKDEKIIISIMTDTGFEAAERVYGKNGDVEIIYFPLDDYFFLKRLYRKFDVWKTVIVETEIWPNLYWFGKRNGELFIVNGRLTEKKMKSYVKLSFFISSTLNMAAKVMVQSEEDGRRYQILGISPEKIKVYKNLKYSIRYEILENEKKEKYIKETLYNNRKIIVCGSTRPGEERIWLEVLKDINRSNEYQLILVPRHLERIEEIVSEIREVYVQKYIDGQDDGQSYSLLSERRKADIILVDRMGILRDMYQMGDYVFVGGTLVDIGGHSILEPLFYGKLPIIGRYYQNIEDIVNDVMKMGFVRIVESKEDIMEHMKSSEAVDTGDFFRKNNEIEKILEELYS